MSAPTPHYIAFDNCKEGITTEHAAYIRAHAPRGDGAAVLRAMDDFARRSGGLMHIGDEKGPLVVSKIFGNWSPVRTPISATNPVVMLELGAFLGYSAVLFASVLVAKFGHENVRAARAAADHSGLGDVVTVLDGPLENHLPKILPGGELDKSLRLGGHGVDLVFLDHWKDLYQADAELILADGLLSGPGPLLIADNSTWPTFAHYPTVLEYSDGKVPDGIEVSTLRTTPRTEKGREGQ
ncbi:hypothetical protein AMAG_11170 [Allomyces macrogynus ATCC 38327]|uniref:catechol O-methyltransferase n=1 Tax=Allomyces macrogynus (strain ATCC 38327) TaxID=578462 RepID=A0A0L0SSS7_ALLM3|nr:hypothetical protein AMAG_11170 [Allomyces macrogynus ATCC 38327]|eukprot:KNE65557.1 hypothetical protein AMAG_11170 [Allomyces macrogynus ATCC 38327]